jgi:uncharacterized phage protein (TIGR02218 family)
MGAREGLLTHLETGATTVCRAWAIDRADGVQFCFTDHDTDLTFDGMVFKANSGLTARALQQSTGLSVDNTEALGALSDLAVTESDLLAGRFDGASLRSWLVNWADTGERMLQFRGSLGEVTRIAGAFQAELRGLAEALNQPNGLTFQKACSAVLGDAACGFDLDRPGYSEELAVTEVQDQRLLRLPALAADRWYEKGRLRVLSGSAAGAIGIIKNDRIDASGRLVELWQQIGGGLSAGDRVRLEAGCDKRAESCRLKFNNFNNFRGFPHIPGEDWLAAYPTSATANDGRSLFK